MRACKRFTGLGPDQSVHQPVSDAGPLASLLLAIKMLFLTPALPTLTGHQLSRLRTRQEKLFINIFGIFTTFHHN